MNTPIRTPRPLSRIMLTAALALAPSLSTFGAVAAHAQTADAASVRIVKDAQPNGPTNFHFTTNVSQTNEEGLDNFTLDDDPTSPRPNDQQYNGVAPGTYWVTEQPTDGWTLDSIDCSGGQVSKDLPNHKLTITVGAGDAVVCTFVNVRKAQGETTTPPQTTPEQPQTTTGTQLIQEGTTSAPDVSGEILAAVQSPAQASAPVALPASLPFTGSNIELLTGFGAVMLAAGAALLARSRSRTASESARP
jgi:hypothetical protein